MSIWHLPKTQIYSGNLNGCIDVAVKSWYAYKILPSPASIEPNLYISLTNIIRLFQLITDVLVSVYVLVEK